MKRLFSLFFFITLLIVVSFLLFSKLENSMEEWVMSSDSGWPYSLASFCVLVSDIVLPVPSSLLMILNGKVLGIFAGTILSFFAGITASMAGFYLGKKSTGFVNRFFSERDIQAGNRFFNQYGYLSIAVSKFIPVLSETISFISGCSNVPVKSFLLYSFIGNAMVAFTYALIGHFALEYNSNLLAGIVISVIVILTWTAGFFIKKTGKVA